MKPFQIINTFNHQFVTFLWRAALERVGKVAADGALVAVDLLAQEVHLVGGCGLGYRVQEVVVQLLHRVDLWPPEEIRLNTLCNTKNLYSI